MNALVKRVVMAALAVSVIALAGCPTSSTVGSVAFSVDLSPAFQNGFNPDTVAAEVVAAGTPVQAQLVIDPTAQTATGTIDSLPAATYDCTVTIESGSMVLGSGSGSVDVAAGATSSITIVIVIPQYPTDPTIGVLVE